LANVPNYVPDLLAGAAPIHKDDAHLARQELVVERGHDRSRDTILAVVSSVPSVAVYERLLAELVQTKGDKQYATDLQFLDLIVEDKTNSLTIVEHERVVEVLIGKDLVRTLASSRFREIFLLTRCKEHARIVVPLKASLLMREVLVFMHACKAIQAEKGKLPSAPAHEVIAEHCNRQGFSVGLLESEDHYFLAFGSMSVVLSEPHVFEFGVHHDHVLATAQVVVSEEVRRQYDPRSAPWRLPRRFFRRASHRSCFSRNGRTFAYTVLPRSRCGWRGPAGSLLTKALRSQAEVIS
jgi:hypothetical protein